MPHNRKFRAIAIDASNSPFSEAILEYKLPKKFVISTFDWYSGQSDPLHYLLSTGKMVIYSRSHSILCRIFLSNLKGVASDWFYSLLQCSIHGFGDLTKLFLTQYSSHQKFK